MALRLWKILQILPEPSTAVLEYLQWVPASPGHIPANAVPAGVGINGMTYPHSNVYVHAYIHICTYCTHIVHALMHIHNSIFYFKCVYTCIPEPL